MTTLIRIDGVQREADRTRDGLLISSCPRCGQRVVQVRVEGLPVLADLEALCGGVRGSGPFVAIDEKGQGRSSAQGVRCGGESLHTLHRLTCPEAVAA